MALRKKGRKMRIRDCDKTVIVKVEILEDILVRILSIPHNVAYRVTRIVAER